MYDVDEDEEGRGRNQQPEVWRGGTQLHCIARGEMRENTKLGSKTALLSKRNSWPCSLWVLEVDLTPRGRPHSVVVIVEAIP